MTDPKEVFVANATTVTTSPGGVYLKITPKRKGHPESAQIPNDRSVPIQMLTPGAKCGIRYTLGEQVAAWIKVERWLLPNTERHEDDNGNGDGE